MPTEKQVAAVISLVLQNLGLLARIKALEDRPAPERGPAGKDGRDGKDAAPEAVRAVVDAEVARQIGLLPKPKDGKDGRDGERGESIKGDKGDDGKSVDPSEIKAMVTAAVKEIPAAKDGRDGEPGRDAPQIDVLPYIETDRSYPRGVYASHRGGLVRSARTTDYLDELKPGETIETKGWQVVINGIGEREIKRVDDRTFAIRLVDTAGKVVEERFAMPVMIYRGVWREGDYQPGDTTTWGGSLWHCEEPTRDKPGTSKAWKLAVKRGQDGKDARAA